MTTSLPNLEISPELADLIVKRDTAKATFDQVEILWARERVGIIEGIQGWIREFKIKSNELYPATPKKKVPADKDYSPDYFYRDPVTGEEWDGKGKKRPKFLHGKKKLDSYRIHYSAAPQAPENSILTVETIGNAALTKADESIDASALQATVARDPAVSEPEAASTAVLVQDSAASVPAIVHSSTSATLADSVAANQLSIAS